MTNEKITEMLNAENISINNGNSYQSAASLTAEQVEEVFDRIDTRTMEDPAEMNYAEEASSEIENELEAKRIYVAAIADWKGEIAIG